MALWGKTDALASQPKYVSRKAYIDSTAVNTTANTIDTTLANTDFATGDAVYYSINGGTVIGGLTDATVYYVRRTSATTIALYDTYAHAINIGQDPDVTTGILDITAAGVGTHTLQRYSGTANVFGDHINNGAALVFVDAGEAVVTANRAKGIKNPGWWLYRSWTNADGSVAKHAECLIAMNGSDADLAPTVAGDTEDTIAADLVITIGTQPADQSVTAPAPATFAVVATVNTVAEGLTYQWQIQQEGIGAWANISGATSASYTTGATATGDGVGATDGDKYRVIVSAVNATPVTSSAATLTVV